MEFYGEEPEFCYRARKNGFKTWYYPHAEIIHYGGASTTKLNKEQIEISLRRYEKIVRLTVGHKYAIGTSRITIISYYLKYFITRNKNILDLISYENQVIRYLKNHS